MAWIRAKPLAPISRARFEAQLSKVLLRRFDGLNQRL